MMSEALTAEVGDRVGALISATDGKVEFLGYGEYVGEEVPPPDSLGFGEILNDVDRENPKLELDNGETVYGCECWWGYEDKVKKRLEEYKDEGMTVEEVSIEDLREEYAEEGE